MDNSPLLDSSFPLPLDLPFTRRTALAAGITDGRLARLTRAGLLRHPIREVYVAAQAPDDIAMRIAILRLVVPDDCFVVDRTAAWLHGAPMALAPNDHLVAPKVAMFRHADRGAAAQRPWLAAESGPSCRGTSPMSAASPSQLRCGRHSISVASCTAIRRSAGWMPC